MFLCAAGATSTGAVGGWCSCTEDAWFSGMSISTSGISTGAIETVPESVSRLVCVLVAAITKSVPRTPTMAVTVRTLKRYFPNLLSFCFFPSRSTLKRPLPVSRARLVLSVVTLSSRKNEREESSMASGLPQIWI